MLTNDKELSALYNSEGEQITEYQYQSFERVGNLGYIVTNSQKQVGLISLDGDEMIPMGEYETLESVDQMFFATKKEERKKMIKNKIIKNKKKLLKINWLKIIFMF